MTHHNRLKNIQRLLKQEAIDGLLLNSEANVSYAAGFQAPDSYCLIDRAGPVVVTDFRYAADFKRSAGRQVRIIRYTTSLFNAISQYIVQHKLKRIGFESRCLSFAECQILAKNLGKRWTIIPLARTLEPLRELKDKNEISSIRAALNITLKALAFAKARVKPGRSEISIAADIERFIRLHGAKKSAFPIIVASGPNAAYPHARVSERILKKGDPVVVDMGVEYNGYKCDLTRTFFLGKINPIVQKVAAIVQEAQMLAIRRIRPGIEIKTIDAAARQYIAQQGFAKNFGHAIGHGVGLEVHESPCINSKNDQTIKTGMIFTIEPGVYLPGRFGIRMEEMVLVTKRGVEVLSGNYRH